MIIEVEYFPAVCNSRRSQAFLRRLAQAIFEFAKVGKTVAFHEFGGTLFVKGHRKIPSNHVADGLLRSP